MNADVTTVNALREGERHNLRAVDRLNLVGAVSVLAAFDFTEKLAALGFENLDVARVALAVGKANGIGLIARALFIAQAVGHFARESLHKTFNRFLTGKHIEFRNDHFGAKTRDSRFISDRAFGELLPSGDGF